MGFVSGLLGTAGGAAGTGFSTPQQTDLLNPTDLNQTQTAYGQSQNALLRQKDFLQAVQAQNGLQNQSNVFNQLQGVANGTGPNPAQAQLAQATQANVANQAALMAGQRGSSSNPGLIARQAAQTGANIQQQAAGQAATIQAQQSLNAMGQLSGIAGQQAQQQANATNAYSQANQNEQQQLLGSIAQQNNAKVGMQSNVNNANSQLAGQQMAGQNNLLSGIAGGVGAALMLADGGQVPQNGQYEQLDPNNDPFKAQSASPQQPIASSTSAIAPVEQATQGPKSSFGKFMSGFDSSQGLKGTGNMIGQGIGSTINALVSSKPKTQAVAGGPMDNEGMPQIDDTMMAAKGGKVPALVSPGEVYLDPKDVKQVAKGKNPLKAGEKIPGKPKYKGNDYRNDTVKKNLDEGGIVIPNAILQGKNPHWEAMRFVHATMAKGGKLPKK